MVNALNAIKFGFATVGGVIVFWLGGLDRLLAALIAVIVLDYLTGIIKAIHTKTLSSRVGFDGIAKKVQALVVVALAFIIENLTAHTLPLREIVIMFFVANEGISILENAAGTGLPIPARLRAVLVQLKGEGDKDAMVNPADQ